MTKKRIVHLAFAFASCVLSFLIWRTVHNDFSVLDGFDVTEIGALTAVVIGVFILCALLFSRVETFVVYAVFLVVFLAVVGFGWQYAIATALAFLLFEYGAIQTRFVSNSRLVARFYPFAFSGAPIMLTGMAVLFACSAYFYPFQVDTLKVPPQLFDWATPLAESFITSRVPYYRQGMTIDEFFQASTAESLKGVDIAHAPAQVKAAVQKEITKQKDGLSKQFGVTFSGNEDFKKVATLVADGYLNRYLGSYKGFVPLVAAAFVFLATKSLGFIVNRFAVFFAWLTARALVVAGVAHKEKTMVEKEVLAI
ncbi:hypothetical protein HY250_00515 [Candidatus Azambacteria bacterium]|nr:hypothetical protein [Candidatus Azambacteria bacterium]MBI3684880.1 hypothetical protein [Candidatus Azambacteria bacterium]